MGRPHPLGSDGRELGRLALVGEGVVVAAIRPEASREEQRHEGVDVIDVEDAVSVEVGIEHAFEKEPDEGVDVVDVEGSVAVVIDDAHSPGVGAAAAGEDEFDVPRVGRVEPEVVIEREGVGQ